MKQVIRWMLDEQIEPHLAKCLKVYIAHDFERMFVTSDDYLSEIRSARAAWE